MIAPAKTEIFLGRYRDPLPICHRGGFQTLSARTLDDQPCVLVLPGEGVPRERATTVFREVARAHERIQHPKVPPVRWQGDAHGVLCLEYVCDAVVDGFELIRLFSASGDKIPFAAADSFIVSLRRAMEAAHRQDDPKSPGSPLCLGRLSLGNILFNPSGHWFLIGFGANYPVENADGTLNEAVAFLQAPELAHRGSPSPTSDFVALLLLTRSLMGYVDLPWVLSRLPQPLSAAVLETMRWVDRHMIVAEPSRRVTIKEAVTAADRVRALAGVTFDPDAFASFAARHLNARSSAER